MHPAGLYPSLAQLVFESFEIAGQFLRRRPARVVAIDFRDQGALVRQCNEPMRGFDLGAKGCDDLGVSRLDLLSPAHDLRASQEGLRTDAQGIDMIEAGFAGLRTLTP